MEQNAAKDDKQKSGDNTPKIIYLSNDSTTPKVRRCPNCGKEAATDATKCANCQTELDLPAKTSDKAPAEEPGNFDSLGYVKSALASKYEVIEVITKTNTSMIFRAVHVHLGKEVALKVLLRSVVQDRGYADAFHRRFRAIDKLSQSNIIRIYDEGVENGIHYAAMEFLKGIDLERKISEQGSLSTDVMIGILMPAISALGHAHRNAIVHGNIKCSSIFLHNDGRIILTGFGTQHSTKGNRVAFSRSPNSFEYLSPEEAGNNGADGRSDIYSLGVVMYHALTGRFPYSESTPEATIKAIIGSQHIPVSKFREVPQWLDIVVNKCLHKDATKRVQSCGELLLLLNAGSTMQPRATMAPVGSTSGAQTTDRHEEKPSEVHPTPAKADSSPAAQRPGMTEPTVLPQKAKASTGDQSPAEISGRDQIAAKAETPADRESVKSHTQNEVESARKGGKRVVAWIIAVGVLIAVGAAVTMVMMNNGTAPTNTVVAPGPEQQKTEATADQGNPPAAGQENNRGEETSQPNAGGEVNAAAGVVSKSQPAASPVEPIEKKLTPPVRSGKPASSRTESKKATSREKVSPEEKASEQPAIIYVVVPDLTGNQLNVAERILSLNGLSVGQVTTIPDPANDGLVVREVPKPGTRLEKGSTVNLIVGSK